MSLTGQHARKLCSPCDNLHIRAGREHLSHSQRLSVPGVVVAGIGAGMRDVGIKNRIRGALHILPNVEGEPSRLNVAIRWREDGEVVYGKVWLWRQAGLDGLAGG